MSVCNIALFSAKNYDEASFEKYGDGEAAVKYFKDTISPQLLRDISCSTQYDAVCTFVNDVVDREVLDTMKELGIKAVLNRCAGFDRVDVAYAAEIGIQVCRVPAYSPYAVAEHAVSLLCTLNRRLNVAYNRTKSGNFSIDGLTGMDLFGKTVGVVGTGKIGQIMIDIMSGFGCKIAAFDVFVNPDYAARDNVTYMTLDELYACSDVISLHSPLLPSTKHMINKESIAKMKDGVIIINAARGGLVDTEALVEALISRKVRGAGLDVYENEAGLFFNDCSEKPELLNDKILAQLRASNNVIISAHQAFLTEEALKAIATVTLTNAREIMEGKTGSELSNWVPPSMV